MKAFCSVQIFSHTALNSENGAELPYTAEKETNNGFSTLLNNSTLLSVHLLSGSGSANGGVVGGAQCKQ